MQQTLRHGMGFCPGAPHGTKATIVSMIRVVGPMGALQEGARPVVAKTQFGGLCCFTVNDRIPAD